jgi:hypothetical protein
MKFKVEVPRNGVLVTDVMGLLTGEMVIAKGRRILSVI